MFDAQNLIIGNLLREIDVGKKDVTSKLLKNAPNIKDVEIQSRLEALKNRNDGDDNNIFPPPPPPPPPTYFPPPPPPQPPQPPPTYFHSSNIITTAIFYTPILATVVTPILTYDWTCNKVW